MIVSRIHHKYIVIYMEERKMGINVRAVEIQDARAIHRICIQ
ncbi:GNAT family N-acetyltransferase, partial [Bacillus thuringiensis]|nr:GNAT family N-acetyltransferase [Bacillus thuringiensis]